MYHALTFVVTILSVLVAGLDPQPISPIDGNTGIFSELRAQLSPDASVLLPGDLQMQAATVRWSSYSRPTYRAVVQVAVEDDIQKTILFANKHSIPFLAVNGAHGMISTLGRMQNGIAISFSKMKSITVASDGKSAELQPGLTNGELIRGLWKYKKYTLSGNCLCTGITGIMLGGGHGYLQGQYGLLADQIQEARVVLANGSMVTASSHSNPDLFWGLRGAGHNFGIVTGLKYKIHDPKSDWTAHAMVFQGDKVEEYFKVANTMTEEGNHRPEFSFFTFLERMPAIDPYNTIILGVFMIEGAANELEPYTSRFRHIGVVNETLVKNIPYPDLFSFNHVNESSPDCDKGKYRHMVPVGLKAYNPQAMRKIYDIFNDVTAKFPETAIDSRFIIEGYANQGVRSVPAESTAYALRGDNILLSPVWTYTDASLSSKIIAAARQSRDILVKASGSSLHAYVNYALGDEKEEELYGFEPWRLQKLRHLKEKYDPSGKFNFYAPIE